MIVYNNFVSKHHILHDNQFGFRTHYSTDHALISVHDIIVNALYSKQFIFGVFMDLSKAFDTIDFSILFKKLVNYGIRGIALNWIKSYFSQRYQFTEYNGYSSTKLLIKSGIPQGSNLGPYFSFYI